MYWATLLLLLHAILLISQEFTSAPVSKCGQMVHRRGRVTMTSLCDKKYSTVTAEKHQPGHPIWLTASRKRAVSLEQTKPANSEVNRKCHMQEVQQGAAEGSPQGWVPSREDTECKACFSLLGDAYSHGWIHHLGQHFFCCFIAWRFAGFFCLFKYKKQISIYGLDVDKHKHIHHKLCYCKMQI